LRSRLRSAIRGGIFVDQAAGLSQDAQKVSFGQGALPDGRRLVVQGSKSTFANGNAPLLKNRIWSVLTGPYFGRNSVPSISGNQSALYALREHITAARVATAAVI